MKKIQWTLVVVFVGIFWLAGCGERIEEDRIELIATFAEADSLYEYALPRLYESNTTQFLERILAKKLALAVRNSRWEEIEQVYRECERFQYRSDVISNMADEVLMVMMQHDFHGVRKFDRAEHVYRQLPSREIQAAALDMMGDSYSSREDLDQYLAAFSCFQTAVTISEVRGVWIYDLAKDRWLIDPDEPDDW